METKIYLSNTLTGKREEFRPLDPENVRMFVCGPTVYGPMHIGHAKTYITYDFMARVIKTLYPHFTYIQNITDVDDKIISKAKSDGKTVTEVAEYWEGRYFENMKILKNTQVNEYYRAHEHIDEIIAQVNILLSKDLAYIISEDGVYLDTLRVEGYELLNGGLENTGEYSRINNPFKKNNGDFALWKFSSQDAPVGWEASFGYGRPGWHIEDTAITGKYLGSSYDIHGGAIDLMFPHHEAEIMIMAGVASSKLANYWPHAGLLTVNGVKMGKSLNNFITVDEVLEKYSPNILRYFMLSKNYNSTVDWSSEALQQAIDAIKRVENYYKTAPASLPNDEELYGDFMDSLYYDFNSGEALGKIFSAIRGRNISKSVLDHVNYLYEVFALNGEVDAPEDVLDLAEVRWSYRRSGDWGKADELRDKIKELGWRIKDGKDSYTVEKI